MPRVMIRSGAGMDYRIDSSDEGSITAWFDEWLPRLWPAGSPDACEPMIMVQPLWISDDPATDPDWFADTWVTGRFYPFPAHTGERAMELLAELRIRLARELVT